MCKLDEFLKKIYEEGLFIVIIPHELADLDALASSIILLRKLKKDGKKAIIYAPSISRETRDLLNMLLISEILNEISVEEPNENEFVVILVDFANPQRSGEKIYKIINQAKAVFSIDHHETEIPEGIEICLINQPSITQFLVSSFFTEGIFDNKLAKLAIAGILQDTAMLQHADRNSFVALNMLREFEDYKKIIQILKKRQRSIDERIARFKGIKRAKLIRLDDLLIAVSEVGSFEASVASALIQIGADIGIVLTKTRESGKSYYRISSRTNVQWLNLGKIMMEVAKKFGGVGGGHKGAAGLMISTENVNKKEEIIKEIIEKIVEEFNKNREPRNL